MLLGLFLYRLGFLQGKLSGKFYGLCTIISLPVGFWLVTKGLILNQANSWDFPYSMFLGSIWNYWGSIMVAIGYISLVGFLLASTSFRLGFNALTHVGKAALSNYIYQTLIAISVFYGFGLGLFGKLERVDTILIVLSIWFSQLILNSLWFRHHSKGPIEALWHKTTHRNWLPFKQKRAST